KSDWFMVFRLIFNIFTLLSGRKSEKYDKNKKTYKKKCHSERSEESYRVFEKILLFAALRSE
ncbi:MAG: hypothetical protein QG635_848, partial [Bacteroidota bacterium]|nr:hypothetical protein [Bacteroidota bacterium]